MSKCTAILHRRAPRHVSSSSTFSDSLPMALTWISTTSGSALMIPSAMQGTCPPPTQTRFIPPLRGIDIRSTTPPHKDTTSTSHSSDGCDCSVSPHDRFQLAPHCDAYTAAPVQSPLSESPLNARRITHHHLPGTFHHLGGCSHLLLR